MQDPNMITVRHHRTVLQYHPAYAPYLQRLGLYQLAVMPNINSDQALIHGLVERWRPETHTFHLPVGEMTITLQDVSCLWGLPIHGEPVGGISDGDYGALVEPLLGIPEYVAKKKRRTGTSAEMVSQYHMKLKVLREHFIHPLPEQHTHEQLLRYLTQ